MALPTFYDYQGYRIVVCVSPRGREIGRVHVYERDLNLGAVYSTTSLDKAIRWIDAYRDGVHWAVEAAIEARAAR